MTGAGLPRRPGCRPWPGFNVFVSMIWHFRAGFKIAALYTSLHYKAELKYRLFSFDEDTNRKRRDIGIFLVFRASFKLI
jgi:hypothetical protein